MQSEGHRAALLAGLACVDLVVIFDEPTPEALVRHLGPDVLVKGSDYEGREIAGADFVRDRGGSVVTIPLIDGLSTTNITRAIGARGPAAPRVSDAPTTDRPIDRDDGSDRDRGAAPPTTDEPAPRGVHVRIRPVEGWRAPDLREVWERRELLWNFAGRSLKVRYKQTAAGRRLGGAPAAGPAAIFSFVFGRVARVSVAGRPLLPVRLRRVLAWQLFAAVDGHQGRAASLVPNMPADRQGLLPAADLAAGAGRDGAVGLRLGRRAGRSDGVEGVAPGPAALLLPL